MNAIYDDLKSTKWSSSYIVVEFGKDENKRMGLLFDRRRTIVVHSKFNYVFIGTL